MNFENYLLSNINLEEDEIHHIRSLARTVTLRRNELILQAGDICRHKIFVVSGLLRTYSIDTNGNEHILQFSPENTWTLDVESYDKAIPSVINIGAVEHGELLLWEKNDFENIRATLPLFRKFAEELISRNIYYNRQRMLTTLSATPEEKYQDFVIRFPNLLQRLPLRMIASYLGISLKTLTRIRHAQLQR
jgi:CRP/FNR family transcriptional regulator, anaerobic regulatory protein